MNRNPTGMPWVLMLALCLSFSACVGGAGLSPSYSEKGRFRGFLRQEIPQSPAPLLYCVSAWTGCPGTFLGLGLWINPKLGFEQEINLVPGYPERMGLPAVVGRMQRDPWLFYARISSSLFSFPVQQYNSSYRGEIGFVYTSSGLSPGLQLSMLGFASETRSRRPLLRGGEVDMAFSLQFPVRRPSLQAQVRLHRIYRSYTFRAYPSVQEGTWTVDGGLILRGGKP